MLRTLSRRTLVVLSTLVLFIHSTTGTACAQKPAREAPTNVAEQIKLQAVDPDIVTIANSFGSLSNEGFRDWLKSVQPAPHPLTYQQSVTIGSGIRSANVKVLADGDRRYRISERVGPVLHLFHREDIIEFIVYENPTPSIDTLYENTIFISTGFLKAVEADDELSGAIAHELAHEISNEAYDKAEDMGDLQALRRYEGQCDAIAALALRAVGMDPTAVSKFLYKIAQASPENLKFNDGTHEHPSLASRLKLNDAMARALRGQVAMRNH